jgi:dolichol kinase
MNYLVKEQNSWGSHNALSLDASIALSAVAALASLVFGGLAATLAFPLLCAVVGSIAVALLRNKKQKRQGPCQDR